jgi:ABC-type sugar transport system ATPase subunit
VYKRFGGVQALRGVSLAVLRGETHALLGENGAGKSTLINILGGVYPCDAGTITLGGQPVRFADPAASQAAGIAIIHQELSTMPALSVMENVFMGRMPARRGVVDWQAMERQTRALLDEVGLMLGPRTPMRRLSIAQAQLVEVARALAVTARLIIMDEPNASLTARESERLFEVIARLKQRGVAVIYVSHRIEDVLRIADRVSVLRDGMHVGTIPAPQATVPQVIRMMVGRELSLSAHPSGAAAGAPLLDVRGLDHPGLVHDVTFAIHSGEIVGLAGLVGAGRSTTAQLIFGALPYNRGEIRLGGRRVQIRSPQDAMRHGIAMVPEDRKQAGLFVQMPVRWNISIAQLRHMSRLGVLRHRAERELARHFVARLGIRTAGIDAPVRNLSGGNQQKTLLARWLATNPRLLILDEPTRGVDVSTKAEIYEIIQGLARRGIAILLISSELPEVLSVSDRIVVMREGRVTGVLRRDEATEDRVMAYATGVARAAA